MPVQRRRDPNYGTRGTSLAVANQAAQYRWLNFDEYYERSKTYKGPPTPQREAAWVSLLPCNVNHLLPSGI